MAAAGFNRHGQGGVVLFDACFHCRCRLLLAFFNTLVLSWEDPYSFEPFLRAGAKRREREGMRYVLQATL